MKTYALINASSNHPYAYTTAENWKLAYNNFSNKPSKVKLRGRMFPNLHDDIIDGVYKIIEVPAPKQKLQPQQNQLELDLSSFKGYWNHISTIKCND